MELTSKEKQMLDGQDGRASKKAMEILVTLGKIYGAESMVPVSSVQVAGVSYANLGEAGLNYLTEIADGGGRTKVLTTLNPAGMDIENWKALNISDEFARNQKRVIDAYERMNIITTCSCTPYLIGNLPHFGEHIAWSESSAVCYANSVIGARTNREGGPSALAAALTGVTPFYGYHLDQNRIPTVIVDVETELLGNHEFGALGKALGQKFESIGHKAIPYIRGIRNGGLENLKSFCASIATYGGTSLAHIQDITPEARQMPLPAEVIKITRKEIEAAFRDMTSATSDEIDFVSIGCPHLSIKEIARIAELLKDKKVRKEFWITTARLTKNTADIMGYTKIIEDSGAKIAADTCCVVAPIKGRFHALATDSAKACYYGFARNNFLTIIKPFDEVVYEALK
ncbi:MAG: aconitase X catalytic domain-containing protein [Anaerolineaceae bacterium]|nr:aconitase X catalytic domain-containing protein [Anaerolineaceae bacterium]